MPLDHGTIRPTRGARISVHCLTEFVFCGRAGIICQLDNQPDEELADGHESDLRFTLLHNVKAIKVELRELTPLVVTAVLLGVTLATLAVIMRPTGYLLLLIPAVFVLHYRMHIYRACQLWEQLRASEEAKPETPDLQNREPQDGNWWSLRNDGFETQKCSEAFFDPEWNLSGSPQLLLRRGNICIPVMRTRIGRTQDGKAILRKQNFVRMAAYCHLIRRNLGDVETPCGLYLDRTSYDVVTVPILPESEKNWKRSANVARETLREFDAGRVPEPAKPALCQGCPHAKLLHPEEATELSGRVYTANCSDYVGRYGESVQCHTCCGDVFRWRVPKES